MMYANLAREAVRHRRLARAYARAYAADGDAWHRFMCGREHERARIARDWLSASINLD